ncbi:hypothetical protein [Actinomadura sp. NBRC 104425]|uniref:hypothetical protein n=1 Tax=Actinomadura sp. NBRC 104425 TaxID=3032204 RepID=UPI002553F939|nr:hypothetical protein [Actinomadura sp. NBRC 104425]
MALLVGLLVGALVVTNVPVTVVSTIKTAVCKVASGSRCDTPEKAGENPGTAGGGRPETVAAPQRGGEKKDDGNCWSWADWACGAVDGLRLGTVDLFTDAWDGVAFAGCLAHLCSHDGFKSNWSGIGALFTTDPRDTARVIVDETTKPIRDDWNNGHKVRAVFRAVPAGLGLIFGGKGLNKLKNLKNRDRAPDPPPLDPPQVIERRAVEAARRGDVETAQKALEDARRHLRRIWEAGADDPTRVSMGERARVRSTVRAAERAVKDAKIRKVLLQTPTGRWANDILNRYNVDVFYTTKSGTFYSPESNQIVISNYKDVDEALSPEEEAIDLVHEANHVLYDHTGKSPELSQPRDKYVDGLHQEEAEGVVRQLEMTFDLREQGAKLDVLPVEETYYRGFHRAVAEAERRGEKLTDAERRRIGRKGAVDALLKELRAGRHRTSTTNERYPDYYGKQWDRANGWSKP